MTSSLIGKGSYGMIFYPPIPSESFKKKLSDDSLFIGKIFLNKKDALKEWKNSVLLRKIPNYQTYFIVSLYYSKVDLNRLSISLSLKDKNEYITPLNKNKLFFFQQYKLFGGDSLYKYFNKHFNKSKVSHFEIVYLLQNVFHAIDILLKYEYVHQDISMNNILINHLSSKIIDLGFNFINFKNFYNIPTTKVCRNDNPLLFHEFTYYLNPPEYVLIHNCDLLNYLKEHPDDNECFQKIIIKVKSNLNIPIHDTKLYKIYNKFIDNSFWNSDFKNYIKEIINKVPIINQLSLIEYYKSIQIHLKSDLYSIGITMLSLDKFINYKYTQSKRNKYIHKYYNYLLVGLINPSPIHRININIATFYIKKIKEIYSKIS